VKVTNQWCWQCWCVCLSLLFGFRASPFSPLLFLSRFLSSYPLTIAFFVSKLPSPFSFKRALSRPKTISPVLSFLSLRSLFSHSNFSPFFNFPKASPLSLLSFLLPPSLSFKLPFLLSFLLPPPLLVLRAVFIGQSLLLCVGSRGAACCRAWGEGDTG